MALMNALRNFGSGLNEEIKEAGSLLRRIRLRADTSAIGANFPKFGSSFGVYDFDAFVALASKFYQEAMASENAFYTKVSLESGHIAVDYDSEIRGVFTKKGKPLAFFRPDYKQQGYTSKCAELQAFRAGRNIPVA